MVSALDLVDVRTVGPHPLGEALLSESSALRGASGVSRTPVSPTAFRVLRSTSDGHVPECYTPLATCQAPSTFFHLCKEHKCGKVLAPVSSPGERIKELRLNRGWTQKELAERVGNIDHSGISNIELGRTPLGPTRARRFAKVFRVSPAEILPPEAERTTLSSLDGRLVGIEETLSGARKEAATGREALMVALAASEVRLAHIEEMLGRLVAQAQAASS